mgnify:CR=1 FL=1
MATGIEAAIAALHAGNLQLAEKLCSQAQQRNPFDAAVVDIMAMIHLKKGDGKTALSLIKNAISMDGLQPLFHNHHGIILKSLGFLKDSYQAYQRALTQDPEAPDVLFNLAILCREMGDLEESLTLGRRATELDPSNAAAFNNFGTANQDLGRFEEAADAYRTAIKLDPGHVGAYCNLAAVLAESDQIHEALTVCHEALEKWPEHAEILNAESNAHIKVHDWNAALIAAEKSISSNPEFAQAHYSKSIILLTQARLEEGWPEFEWRVRRTNFWPQRDYDKPLWNGGSLAGKKLLVHWEQGFGDILQFSRYLTLIRGLDPPPTTLLFDCPAKLIPFFSDWDCIDTIGDFGDAPPEFDVFTPLMSLPHLLGTTLETIPADTPYLTNSLTEYVKVPVLRRDNLKVGIVWASDHGNSYRRKLCPVKEIASLFDIEDITFYNLQFGDEAKKIEAYTSRANVQNMANELGDFDHTAAIIKQMDMILSIDTYIVHLAGAMNIPVWVMLAFAPDWRWFLDRSDSPWYPCAKLFRQKHPGDWTSVLDAIRKELKFLMVNKK